MSGCRDLLLLMDGIPSAQTVDAQTCKTACAGFYTKVYFLVGSRGCEWLLSAKKAFCTVTDHKWRFLFEQIKGGAWGCRVWVINERTEKYEKRTCPTTTKMGSRKMTVGQNRGNADNVVRKKSYWNNSLNLRGISDIWSLVGGGYFIFWLETAGVHRAYKEADLFYSTYIEHNICGSEITLESVKYKKLSILL